MRVTLFHNPNSGPKSGPESGRNMHSKAKLLAMLGKQGFVVTYCSTLDDAFENAFGRPAELLVAAGGDGTVRKVATRLLDRRIPIAILPLGTANNIAHSLGIGGDIENIVNGWRDGERRRYDIGLAMGPWEAAPFIEAVGVGAFAETMNTPSNGDGEGRVTAGRKAFARALEKAEPLETAVHVDGTPMIGDWLAIEVLNLSRSGPALWLAPLAHPGNGQLDVLCISQAQLPSVLSWLVDPDAAAPPIDAVPARRVAFEWDPKHPLRIDDELQQGHKKGTRHAVVAELQPVPLQFLLPKGSASQRLSI